MRNGEQVCRQVTAQDDESELEAHREQLVGR